MKLGPPVPPAAPRPALAQVSPCPAASCTQRVLSPAGGTAGAGGPWVGDSSGGAGARGEVLGTALGELCRAPGSGLEDAQGPGTVPRRHKEGSLLGKVARGRWHGVAVATWPAPAPAVPWCCCSKVLHKEGAGCSSLRAPSADSRPSTGSPRHLPTFYPKFALEKKNPALQIVLLPAPGAALCSLRARRPCKEETTPGAAREWGRAPRAHPHAARTQDQFATHI